MYGTERPPRVREHSGGVDNLMEQADMTDITRIPPSRHPRADCGDRSPVNGYRCNRAAGHTGRHNFSWRHLDGRVREVWI